jgi:hypothetical protein
MKLTETVTIGRASTRQIDPNCQQEAQQEEKSPNRTCPRCSDWQQKHGYSEFNKWQQDATWPNKRARHAKPNESLTRARLIRKLCRSRHREYSGQQDAGD